MVTFHQIEAQLRGLLMLGAGFAVGRGWLQQAEVELVVGALLAVIGAGWAVYVNRQAALVDAAASVDAVKKIELKHTPEGRALDEVTGPKAKVE